jgi:chemosensory pili system protein ChpE
MTSVFVAAFLMGLVFNAAPGAVFAETVRRGLRGGFRPALDVQVGSLVGDASWAVLGLAGVGLLLQVEVVRLPLGLAGVMYLLWLARTAWKDAESEIAITPEDGAGSRSGAAMRAGMTLSLTNPQNMAFWAAMGSAMGSLGVSEPTPAHYAMFFAGFMLASLVWAFVCAALVVKTLGRASGSWIRLTYRLCALGFIMLALSSLNGLLSRPAAALKERADSPLPPIADPERS